MSSENTPWQDVLDSLNAVLFAGDGLSNLAFNSGRRKEAAEWDNSVRELKKALTTFAVSKLKDQMVH